MRRYLLNHFVPYPVGGVKCQTIMSNDYKGIDLNLNIRPAIMEIYECNNEQAT